MHSKIRLLPCVFLLWLFPAAVLLGQGNLIFNGDFEAGSQGWTLIRGAKLVGGGNPGRCIFLGSTNASPATEPTASQSITSLTPMAIYLVSGDYEAAKDRGGASPTNASFGVAFNGNYVFETAATPNGPWQHFSFLYSPAASSELLSLSSQLNGTGVEYFIDNLSMQIIPEPSAMVLLVLGGVLFGIGLFRKGLVTPS